MAMEDKEIIQLYFDRDEAAIKATDEKYGNYCLHIARNILDSEEDAKECLNDTYLKTWNVIPPSKPEVLRTFLGKIIRNVAFDRYRRMNADKRGKGQIDMVLEEISECVSEKNTLETEYRWKELQIAINSFLGTLPKEKCAIFVRRYWYTDSVADIAKKYSLSENYVSVNLNRLRKKLRDYLTERGFEL